MRDALDAGARQRRVPRPPAPCASCLRPKLLRGPSPTSSTRRGANPRQIRKQQRLAGACPESRPRARSLREPPAGGLSRPARASSVSCPSSKTPTTRQSTSSVAIALLQVSNRIRPSPRRPARRELCVPFARCAIELRNPLLYFATADSARFVCTRARAGQCTEAENPAAGHRLGKILGRYILREVITSWLAGDGACC